MQAEAPINTIASASDTDWYRRPAPVVIAELASNAATGLSDAEAFARLTKFGPNEIGRERSPSPLRMLFRQFTDFMILVLVGAAIVAGVIGEAVDAVAILVIVLLNAIVGAIQEYRAHRAITALRRMSSPQATVLRASQVKRKSARELVPGDIILFEAGDVIPADARIVETTNLRVDESSLTGESTPVEKTSDPLVMDDLQIADRLNVVHMTSAVVRGQGKAVVVATGAATAIGRIAEMLRQETPLHTPLQKRLGRFGRHLALIVLGICAVLFLLGVLQGRPPLLMFLTAVSLAVAAVPEALPAVVTISLALGARILAARNALVRRLPAVETLGSVTFICADKTGTLTQNRMSVGTFVTAEGQSGSLPPENGIQGLWQTFGQAMALSNDVQLRNHRPQR